MKNNLSDLNNHLFAMLEELGDGDYRNCGIGNLMCVTRVEHSVLNRRGLRSADPELTETGLLVARLSVSISRKSRERNTDGEEKI